MAANNPPGAAWADGAAPVREQRRGWRVEVVLAALAAVLVGVGAWAVASPGSPQVADRLGAASAAGSGPAGVAVTGPTATEPGVTGTVEARRGPAGPAAPGARAGGGQRAGSRPGADAQAATADVIEAAWAGPAVGLDWRGNARPIATRATFVGDRVAVPGDLVTRTLTVRNAGPADGVMRVDVVPRAAVGPRDDGAALERNVRLMWDVGQVAGGEVMDTLLRRAETEVAAVRVARDATVPVTVGFTMPFESTEQDVARLQRLEFDVVVTIEGASDDVTPFSWLPRTGASGLTVGLLGLALLTLSIWLRIARRRALCDLCSRRADTETTRLLTASGAGAPRPVALCRDCATRYGRLLGGVGGAASSD
ncbi:hypothetical protein [Xylanimonas ulmi]|nr:hypothetical protein [Xylanibacterium ulmi]